MNSFKNRLGFIQGRLSPIIDGKIQAFPALHWREEFFAASELELKNLEWTLDHDGLSENPFLSKTGQEEIKKLCQENQIAIPSVTGDFFMQAPFFKAQGKERETLFNLLIDVIKSMEELSSTFLVIPLVDNGRINSKKEEEGLVDDLLSLKPLLEETGTRIAFESDYSPKVLASFIDSFPSDTFGINYDSGNSASLGLDVNEEWDAYSERIINIHIKDRILGGTTVPLGEGSMRFKDFVTKCRNSNYRGNFIFQTARAQDENHKQVLKNYLDFFENHWNYYES